MGKSAIWDIFFEFRDFSVIFFEPSGEKNIGKSRNEKNISILHESHAITLLSSIQKILSNDWTINF